MKKKHQFVLVLGIINVILPVIPILAHRGLFGMVENGWKFIWGAAIMILLPFVSSSQTSLYAQESHRRRT